MFNVGDRVKLDGERTGFVLELTPHSLVVQLNDGLGPALRVYLREDEYGRLQPLDD